MKSHSKNIAFELSCCFEKNLVSRNKIFLWKTLPLRKVFHQIQKSSEIFLQMWEKEEIPQKYRCVYL
jgi:hypothetical protein